MYRRVTTNIIARGCNNRLCLTGTAMNTASRNHLLIRKCTGYNQRPLNEKGAMGQAMEKINVIMNFLTRPGRARSLLVLFGAYLIFAFSMYNLKTKITVDELKKQLKTVEEEQKELRGLLIESEILPNIEKRLRADAVAVVTSSRTPSVNLREEIRKIMFPTEVEKDGQEYDRLQAERAAAAAAEVKEAPATTTKHGSGTPAAAAVSTRWW